MTDTKNIVFATVQNLTIRASLAPPDDTIFTQGQNSLKGQKVKYINTKIQITTRARKKRLIGGFSSSCNKGW